MHLLAARQRLQNQQVQRTWQKLFSIHGWVLRERCRRIIDSLCCSIDNLCYARVLSHREGKSHQPWSSGTYPLRRGEGPQLTITGQSQRDAASRR
jgi:hypothetical protein